MPSPSSTQPRPAAARPGRLGPRTLRGRLIAGLLALLAVACAAVGLATYVALHRALMSQLDQQLNAVSLRYGTCLETGPGYRDPPSDSQHSDGQDSDHDNDNIPGGPQMCGQEQGPQTFSASIGGTSFHNPTVTGSECPLTQTDRTALMALRSSGTPSTISLSSLGPYQLMARPGQDGTKLVTGLPLAPVQSTLRDVELTEIVVFSAALVLTGLLGTGFVRLSLRPLRRVAATATRVTQLPLASGQVTLPDRVPDANPRTEVGQVGAAFTSAATPPAPTQPASPPPPASAWPSSTPSPPPTAAPSPSIPNPAPPASPSPSPGSATSPPSRLTWCSAGIQKMRRNSP